MVNKNTSTGTISGNATYASGSNIYLKKSELPKSVSAFKNDVNYITPQALTEWLKKHSYIPVDEIKELIAMTKVVVSDSSTKEMDEETIKKIYSEIGEIKDRLRQTIGEKDSDSKYVTIEKSGEFAKQTDLKTICDLVKELQEAGKNYLTKHQSLEGYATKEWVEGQGYLKEHQSLEGYAKKTDIPAIDNLAGKEELDKAVSEVKVMVPSLDGYATKKWVEDKGYATKSQLTGYATKSDVITINSKLSSFVTKDVADNRYANKNDIKREYLTKKEASDVYLTIEDYRGIKNAATLSDQYADKTIEEFTEIVGGLSNGFYVVNKNDMAIVKDHKIISIVKDGVAGAAHVWEYEE